ncbi:carbohydrate ABC transporter permease, partial [Mycoplasmopsis synoviae]
WNDFLLPNLIKNAGSYNLFTLIVNLYSNIEVHALNPGQIMAGVTSIIIPVVVFFIVMQKNIVSGITNGAIK